MARKSKTTGTKKNPCRKKTSERRLPDPLGEGLLKSIDKKILGIILNNARMTNIEIAMRIGSSEATVRRRIQYMIENGLISGFSVNVDYKRMGVNFIRVLVYLDVDNKALSKVVNEFSDMSEAYYVYQILGSRFNVLCGYVFQNLEAMDSFLDYIHQIEGIETIEYYLITEDYITYPCDLKL